MQTLNSPHMNAESSDADRDDGGDRQRQGEQRGNRQAELSFLCQVKQTNIVILTSPHMTTVLKKERERERKSERSWKGTLSPHLSKHHFGGSQNTNLETSTGGH